MFSLTIKKKDIVSKASVNPAGTGRMAVSATVVSHPSLIPHPHLNHLLTHKSLPGTQP